MAYKIPFVDYYKEHGISPVSQDISDLGVHYNRRRALYAHLGIPGGLLSGKSILEFGPGSGHNAVFTASLKPARYVFVDGNPKGLSDTRELMNKYNNIETECEYHELLIEDYESDKKFDLVICEGVLPYQKHPEQMVQHIASFVQDNGVISITCHDSISIFADLLRHYAGRYLTEKKELDFKGKVNYLSNVFVSHLKSLSYASRPVEDWVCDNVLRPFAGALFSIKDAICSLAEVGFGALGSSPRFFSDWRWYKEMVNQDSGFNELALDCYEKQMHVLLNHTSTPTQRDRELNARLVTKTDAVYEIIRNADKADDCSAYLTSYLGAVKDVIDEVEAFDESSSKALRDYYLALDHLGTNNTSDMGVDWGAFAHFWGRGMQYLSFIKRASNLDSQYN